MRELGIWSSTPISNVCKFAGPGLFTLIFVLILNICRTRNYVGVCQPVGISICSSWSHSRKKKSFWGITAAPNVVSCLCIRAPRFLKRDVSELKTLPRPLTISRPIIFDTNCHHLWKLQKIAFFVLTYCSKLDFFDFENFFVIFPWLIRIHKRVAAATMGKSCKN